MSVRISSGAVNSQSGPQLVTTVPEDVESGLSVRSLDTDLDSLSAFCNECLATGGAGAAFFFVLFGTTGVADEAAELGLTAKANRSIHSVYKT